MWLAGLTSRGGFLKCANKLSQEINQKKKELELLVSQKKTIKDTEVYQKSVELDRLVVQYMRKNGRWAGLLASVREGACFRG